MQGQLCVLAEDCDQPDYKKLVEALCSEHNVSLLSVPEAKQLGQWAGVSRTAFMSYNDRCICFTSEQQSSLERLSRSLGKGLRRRCRWHGILALCKPSCSILRMLMARRLHAMQHGGCLEGHVSMACHVHVMQHGTRLRPVLIVQLCKIDAEGEARKVVGCSSVVVTNWGEETPGRSVLQEYLKNK